MNFPVSPVLNQTYSFNGRVWKWNGKGWEIVLTSQVSWSSISDKPAAYTPAAHVHAISDVTGLQSALDGKMPSYGGSIVGEYPNIVFQDTELAVDAAGLWSFAIANGTVQFVKNTAAAGDFSSLFMALEIDGSGNVVAAGTVTATDVTITSDARLKSDVYTLYGALDMVQAMRGVRYTIDGKRRVGVIAQETQAVLPEVVIENSDGMLSVAYGNIVGVLIEAVKELKAEVDSLKQELGRLQ